MPISFPGFLYGTVIDTNSGESIVGANMNICDIRDITVSNLYYATILTPGTHVVTCSATGYQTKVENVFITSAEKKQLDFRLVPTT